MSLSPETWSEIVSSADRAGDLARKAAVAIVEGSALADYVTEAMVMREMGRTVIDLEALAAEVARMHAGSGVSFLMDLVKSLDPAAAGVGRKDATVSMLGFWDLDLSHRGLVIGALQRYAH